MENALKNLISTVKDPSGRNDLENEMKSFSRLFQRYLQLKNQPKLEWEKVKALDSKQLIDYHNLGEYPPERVKELLGQLVVLKLNGGLGTTMGCVGPKSVIKVRKEETFLDIVIQQIKFLNEKYDVNIPLVLMNSFNTDEDTQKIIKKYKDSNVTIKTFNQHMFPRIIAETLLPAPTDAENINKEEWYPPGHGDVFDCLYRSPVYKELIDQGKKYIFFSNIDNLGATIDLKILNHLVTNDIEFCMEVTNKTRADVKGGTLIEYEGKVKLLELASVPHDKVDEFKSIRKFKVFNTNNLWISLPAIEKYIDQLNQLEIIINYKEMRKIKVIQLECACGSAIEKFTKAIGINVDRSRFLPVKSTSDLLPIQSNIYKLENGSLIFNPQRVEKIGEATLPIIKLGREFAKVGDYMRRFKGIPDILELDNLTVIGDVVFGKNVSLKGTVMIIANPGSRIEIPDGSILENKIITGNLTMIDY